MQFFEYSKRYLEKNRMEWEGREFTKDDIYGLRKELKYRLDVLLYPYYFILDGKVKKMEDFMSFVRVENNDELTQDEMSDRGTIYRWVSPTENVLYELLLENICFRGEGSNGKKLNKSEWEVLHIDIRKQILKYLSILSVENSSKWPILAEDMQKICMKLLHPQEYRRIARRDEMRTYIKQTDIVDLLDDKLFDELYEFLFERSFSKKNVRKEWEAIAENYVQYVEEKYSKQIEENLLEEETKE